MFHVLIINKFRLYYLDVKSISPISKTLFVLSDPNTPLVCSNILINQTSMHLAICKQIYATYSPLRFHDHLFLCTKSTTERPGGVTNNQTLLCKGNYPTKVTLHMLHTFKWIQYICWAAGISTIVRGLYVSNGPNYYHNFCIFLGRH